MAPGQLLSMVRKQHSPVRKELGQPHNLPQALVAPRGVVLPSAEPDARTLHACWDSLLGTRDIGSPKITTVEGVGQFGKEVTLHKLQI